MEILTLVIVATSLWMAIDSSKLGYRKEQIRGLASMGPIGWLFGGLFLWIVAFPLYLVKREELRRAGEVARSGAPNVAAVPVIAADNSMKTSFGRLAAITFITVCIALIVIVGVGLAIRTPDRSAELAAANASLESLPPPYIATAPAAIVLPRVPAGTIAELKANGIRKTKPFTVSDRWELQWENRGGYFSATLYDEAGEMVDLLANQTEKGPGSSFVPRGGTFTLDVNATGPWAIRVVQME